MKRRWIMRWAAVTGALLLGAALGGCTEITLDAGDWPKWDGNAFQVHGSGVLATKTFDVQGFDRITAWGIGRVIIEKTGREHLTVTGDDNIVPYLRAEVVGGTLRIGPDSDFALSTNADLVYRLEVVEMTQISASGAVVFDVDIGSQAVLAVDLSGATVFVGEGVVDELDVHTSGASRFAGLAMESGRVRVHASGASAVTVWAVDRLEGAASGVAAVRYIGNPTVAVSVSGLATVGPH
jgi:hypothetical protein